MRYFPLLIVMLIFMLSGCSGSGDNINIRPENAGKGQALFSSYNCTSCHSMSGDHLYGPPLNNILYREVQTIRDGVNHTSTVDRKYLIRSIREPGFEKVNQYQKRTMPVPVISPEDLELIVDYIMYSNLYPGNQKAGSVK